MSNKKGNNKNPSNKDAAKKTVKAEEKPEAEETKSSTEEESKKTPAAQPSPKSGVTKEPEITLDTLSVEAVDGIGPKITKRLKKLGINTLQDLVKVDPVMIYEKVQVPVHRMMEMAQKGRMILSLELDPEILDALAEKNYTIEQAIEEKPEVLMRITKKTSAEIVEFLKKMIQVTIFLDAYTSRTNSVAILHRLKKPEPEKVKPRPKAPGGVVGESLDTLSVEAIDGIGPTLTKKLNNLGVYTLADLVRVNPPAVYKAMGLPVHKIMELRKKAQMILSLELDEDIINPLAEKDYTIEELIEEDPIKIRDLVKQPLDDVMEFLDNVVQITLFLDAATCRNNSVKLLHKSKKVKEAPKTIEAEYEEVRYLGKEQILAKIFSTELDYTILRLLRERARNKNEIVKLLENKLMKPSLRAVNDVIDLLVQTELVQLEWFEGNFDVHLFLISDFTILRTPAIKIIEEAEKDLPSPEVAEKYLEAVAEYFTDYKPTYEDNLEVAKLLRDPDIFVTLTLLRNRIYPLKKFPKGMGDGVDMLSIIHKMEDAGIVKIIPDETKEEWVMLLTDLRAPQFYPEYMIENIRADAEKKFITPQLAEKHLDLLEMHYDNFYEIYSTFFRE
ncbi:MAG: helix-hairpin-helix domain-containing protein [Candidatus Helarchaeota archaeon]